MGTNYGIMFCRKVLADLKKIEDQMFAEKGHGFDYFGKEFQTEKKYRRWLKKFEREKDLGLPPSYDPEFHGSQWE